MLCFGLQPFLHSQAPERAFQMLSALQRHRHMIGRAAGLSHALSSLAAAATPALATHTVSYTPLHSSVAHAAVAASTRSFSAASSAPQQQRSHRPRNPSDNPSKPSPNRNASPAAAGQPSKVSGVYEFTSKYRPRFGKRASPRVRVQLDDVLTRFLDTAEVPTADAITFEPIACPPEFDAPIARLAPGLQSVVTSGSVSTTSPIDSLQKVDFPAHIYQPEEIRWDLIPPFITASRDPVLLSLVANNGGRFFGSTSSCSPILSQVAFALTSFMPVQVPQLSQWFAYMPRSHTRAAVKPSCNILRRRRPEFLAAAGVLASGSAPANAAAPEANEAGDAVSPEATAAIASRDGSLWGIDNYPVGSPKRNQVLIDLGKSLERQLTMDPEEFARTMVIPRDADGNLIHPTEEELEAAAKAQAGADLREAYRFVKAGELVLRSQLDCYDEGVDGPKKVFDLKTRAVLPIRLDVENHSDYLSYSIERKEGVYSSFEREWYDMARAAFLKYSFQCRIGDMGGIFVGYHNTARLFGFQYISLDEMDTALYGSPALAQAIYEQCVRLLELSLHRIVDDCAESAGVSHDAIRVTVRAFSNRFEVFTETLPPLPAPGTRTSKDIEAALLDIHCGAMRVDSLTDDEVREALATRNAKTTGTRAELSARLEDLVAAADGVYTVPPIDYLVARVNTDNVRMYTVGLDVLVNGAPRVALNTFKDGDKLHSLFQFKRVTDHAPEEVAHAYAEALTEWLLREEDRPEDTAKASDVQAQLAAVAAATGRSLSNAHSADSASAVGAGAETLGNVVSTETSRDRDGNNMTTTRFEDRTSAVVVTDAEGRVLRASHFDADGTEISVEAPPVPLEVRKSGRRLQAERILRERERLEKFFEGEKGGMSPDMLLTMQRKRAIEQTSRRRTSRKVM